MDANSNLNEEAIAAIIEHMNDDHTDALELYLTVFARVECESRTDVELTSVDETGIEIAYSLSGKPLVSRLDFADTSSSALISSRVEARQVLVEMVKIAHKRQSAE